jgi:acyl-CoA thioester hydrolase
MTLALCGLSRDGSRFRIRNEFLKEDGTRVAQLNSLGGWMDLETRKLVSPPPALAAALDSLPRTDDFEEIMVERART